MRGRARGGWSGGRPGPGSIAIALAVSGAIAAVVLATVPRLTGATARPTSSPLSSPASGPASPTAPAASQTPPLPSADAAVLAHVQAPADLDPAALTRRSVGRAAVLVAVVGPTGRTTAALDADTWEWVTPVVPGLDPSSTLPFALSPDGRRVALPTPWPASGVTIVELATGARTTLASPAEPGCRDEGYTWTPDGREVAFVTGCLPADERDLPTGQSADVFAVDVTTRAVRRIEHVVRYAACEAYPAISPDGRLLAYGIATADAGEGADPSAPACGVRVLDMTTGTATVVPGTHMAYGDPWLDDTHVLTWDEADRYGGAGLSLDGVGGQVTPLPGVVQDGALGGTPLLRDFGTRTTCPVALCTGDPDTGSARPWLAVPPGTAVGTPSVARAISATR